MTTHSQSVPLATVSRGDVIESIHRGHLVVIDGEGNTILSFGDPDTVTFIRSAAKPFQLMPCLLSGAADRFGFTETEIALACASHSGESVHVKTAAGMLAKAGLSEADLRCGHHFPFDEKHTSEMIRSGEKPNQLHNNCSGKHSAMLAYAKHLGADLASYEDPSNHIQQEILKAVSLFAGVTASEIPVAVDGCSAPNYALPLRAMAKSFLNLVAPPAHFDEKTRESCGRISAAMMNHPELVGGTERLDTLVMQAAPGKVVCKVGAEGVWLCGVVPSAEWPTGLGIALKIEDGDDKRGRPVVGIELMRRLGVLRSEALAAYSPLDIKTRKGQVVGKVEACADLNVK